MTRPDKIPEFARLDQIDPTTSNNNVIEPPESVKDSGLQYQEKPKRNWLNWLFRYVYKWLAYFTTPAMDPFAVVPNTLGDLSFIVKGGTWISGKTVSTFSERVQAALVAPSVNPRIDLVYLDISDGAIGVVTGIEAASPVVPDLSVGPVIPLATLSLSVGMTEITANDVGDQRVMFGGLSTQGDSPIFNEVRVDGILTATNHTKLKGSGIGDENIAYHAFYESDGIERQGYVGFGSATHSDMLIVNDIPGGGLSVLSGEGGSFTYNGANVLAEQPAIAGFTKGETCYIDDDGDSQGANVFDIGAAIGAVWESIGPTGSGATNIWSALDNLPSNTKWVEIGIYAKLARISTSISQYIFVRRSGSAAAIGPGTRSNVAYMQSSASISLIAEAYTTKKVPVTDVKFDAFLSASPSITSQFSYLHLIDFGA